MKKVMLGAAVILIATGGLFAQKKETDQNRKRGTSRVEMQNQRQTRLTPEEIAKIKVERMDKAVQLSATQKADLETIYLDDATKNKERMAQRQQTNQKVRAVLTTDQIEVLDASKQKTYENKEAIRSPRGQRPKRDKSN